VDHQEACKWVMRSFADYKAVDYVSREQQAPQYTGGFRMEPTASPDAHIAVAWEAPGGWSSPVM